ncbi:MAG: phosphate ABC transporter substrate-binding/OmpA family protein [bacterium]|nr:phosphate ABC transporter substrate-binding/OmpA family protein [bacterium]
MKATIFGKLLLTVLILGVVGYGVYRWRDKIMPPTPGPAVTTVADIAAIQKKLLAGDKQVSLVDASAIPPVAGVSDYATPMKNGKLVVQFPINVWPGWAPIIAANNGLDANDNSIFYKQYGFYVQLSIVDDPVKARDLFASGHSHILWGTLDMIALFAPALVKDSRTVPVVCQQIDWSDGGDGVVARGEIRSINDFRMKNGIRKKVVLAQNSPSHYFIMSLLLEAGIDPAQVDFRWAADAPSAAKIFVQDPSFDAFVGWAPDIYIVAEQLKGARIVVSTESANRLVADVWAVRNDFFTDHPDIVANLARGIFAGVELVRRDVDAAAALMASVYSIPKEDCLAMIGKDGGIKDGDAHLCNYRENYNFFLDPMNPANFEVVWNRASTIYQTLGAIDAPVPPSKVKAAKVMAGMVQEYKDVIDLSQPIFKPNMVFKQAEAAEGQVLTKAVIIQFEPNSSVLNTNYDGAIVQTLKEIGELAGSFGNAYIVIEGNTDASRKGVVPADMVRQLSYDRADTVKKAIIQKYKFDANKFKTVGNGWDNPLPGMTDPSQAENNTKNRRVEVKVYPLEE